MLRPYQLTDKTDLIKIFRLNTPKYFHPDEEIEFVSYLTRMGATYFVIEKDKKIIGGVGYEIRKSDKSGRINWIFLDPAFHNAGIGKLVVEQINKILKSDPAIEKLIVRTSQLAYKFFEKLGYILVEKEKDYWAPGLDLNLMERKL